MKSRINRGKNTFYETKVWMHCTSSSLTGLAAVGRAGFEPIILTPDSYNQDVVVEKSAQTPLVPGAYVTASMDGGTAKTGNTWNEQGYFSSDPSVGLPPA
ncbi:MAG: hypothetical protein N3G20_07180 [Verrucomicrobiae bacterium]|nr:hypothetical protein [Verrucomicrobiae bacterium]